MLFIYIHNVSVTLQFKQTSSSRQCLGTTEQLKNKLAKWWPLLYNGKVQMARVGEDLGWWPKHWVYKFNGSHCWKFGCRRLSERYQRLEYEDFDNKEVPSNVPLASSSSFFTVARTNFLCTCIQVFRKIYKSTSKFILIIKMYVFIYEAPNMSTETLQFPLDIPKYLLPSLPIVKLPCNEKTSTYWQKLYIFWIVEYIHHGL